MTLLRAAAVALPLMFASLSYAQNQQAAPPPGDQSSYPSETHKMSSAEKRDTPSNNGLPVDLNSASIVCQCRSAAAASYTGVSRNTHPCLA